MKDNSGDELFKRLRNSGLECKSLVKKYLTPALYDKYKRVTTNFGGTLKDCIKSGEFDFLGSRFFLNAADLSPCIYGEI